MIIIIYKSIILKNKYSNITKLSMTTNNQLVSSDFKSKIKSKKIRIILVLLGIIIILITIFLYIPIILNLFTSDIAPINDSDLKLKKTYVSNEDNAYFDLKKLTMLFTGQKINSKKLLIC